MTSLSIVIPLKDEAQSLPPLYQELKLSLDSLHKPYEIIFVDDGSTDKSASILLKLTRQDPSVKIITFRASLGKSEALAVGFRKAKGVVIATLDADLQDDPGQLPLLLAQIDKGYDLVVGWRKKRFDHPVKILSTRLFNFITSLVSKTKLHDINCGLKVFTKNVAQEIYLYGELHRFIPILAERKKFKVTEVVVKHRPRKYGLSKYGSFGLSRGWKGFIDLFTSLFITDFSTKPAHFFGSFGIAFFLLGFIMDAYVTYIKITTGFIQGKVPLLLAGVLFILLGVQLISTGLIAEMIIYYFHRSPDRNKTLQ